jgi:acetyl esterase
MSVPADIAQALMAMGSGFNLPEVQALYAPLLAGQPTAGVALLADQAYGEHPRQRLDVYQPSAACQAGGAAKAGAPVLVFLHGGGFIRGDKGHKANIGWHFARQGVLAVLPNYRLAPEQHWPSGPQDVVATLRWVQANAARFGGDPARVVLMGESAGAAHVAAAVLMQRFGAYQGQGLGLRGAVLASGPYDARLERLARSAFGVATPDPRNDAYFATDDARALADCSITEQVDAAPLPLLISAAERDLLQMQVQAGALFSRLTVQHGFAPELLWLPHHNHFSQTQAINTGDTSLSGPVLAFIERHA